MKFADYHNAILALEAKLQALCKDSPCSPDEIDAINDEINGVLDEMQVYTDSLIAASNKRMLGQE